MKLNSAKKSIRSSLQSNHISNSNQDLHSLELYGFEEIEKLLISSWQQNKFHHALLINGSKGIGKASFAKKFVLQLLEPNDKNYSLNHPDLLLITKEDIKKEINIEQIRQITAFINHTSAIFNHKFIIIDAADELNKAAANALLKILEEPLSNNFLILISHNLNKILPTIKSRCRLIKVNNLNFDNFKKALISKAKKEIKNDQELEFLALISEYSPAKALSLIREAGNIYKQFLTSILNNKIDDQLVKKISEKATSKASDNNSQSLSFEEILVQIIYFFFKRLIFFLNNPNANFYALEENIFKNLNAKKEDKNNFNQIFALIDEVTNLLNQSRYLNLDKKLTFINIFNLIATLFL
jgi:DNA polymerase-3 subunit delta'